MNFSWPNLTYCGSVPEFDEAGKAGMREKAQRAPPHMDVYAQMSDEWVADRARMLSRNDIDHEAILMAARDRIMRLSLRIRELSAGAYCTHCGEFTVDCVCAALATKDGGIES